MAKLSQGEREELAATGILRVLGTMTIANQRTLEQKIADAGPFNQRIDPHILTIVRKRLITEGAIARLPVGKFHGIGPATAAKFHALGILTGLDIRGQTLAFLEAHFGKAGDYYYWISRGIDDRPVRANRIRKSVGAENTFFTDLTEFDALVADGTRPSICVARRRRQSTVQPPLRPLRASATHGAPYRRSNLDV